MTGFRMLVKAVRLISVRRDVRDEDRQPELAGTRPLPRGRDHEGRPVRVLPAGRAGAPPAPARPSVHDEALPRGDPRAAVLPEAGAKGDAEVDSDEAVPDVAAGRRIEARGLPA